MQIPIWTYRMQNKLAEYHCCGQFRHTVSHWKVVGQYDVCHFENGIHHHQTIKIMCKLFPRFPDIEQIACDKEEQWHYKCQDGILSVGIRILEGSAVNEYYQKYQQASDDVYFHGNRLLYDYLLVTINNIYASFGNRVQSAALQVVY